MKTSNWTQLMVQILFFNLLHVGTATACYGNDPSQFPSSNLFAAVGDGIWDNGAACGRQYLVKCISAAEPGTCVPDQVIQVRIVDFAATAVSPPSYDGTTMVLSDTAFGTIANSTALSVNIEFQRYTSLSLRWLINHCYFSFVYNTSRIQMK